MTVPAHARHSPQLAPAPRILDAAAVARLAVAEVDAGVAAVALRQGGPVALWQLRALGLSDHQVWDRRRAGRLFAPLRGVYVPGQMRWEAPGQSIGALLSVGCGWLCDASAAWWLGLLDSPPAQPHVLRVGASRHQRRGLVQHASRRVAAADVTTVRGVPTTTPARTLLELAASGSPERLERAVANAEVRRLVSRRDVAVQLGRWERHRGAAALRAALGDLRPAPTRSETERRFRRLWHQAGGADYEANVRVAGRERDVVFRDLRVVVELDGASHFSEAGRQQDLERDAALRAAGWEPMRFSGHRVRHDSLRVVAELSAVLALARRSLEDRQLAVGARLG